VTLELCWSGLLPLGSSGGEVAFTKIVWSSQATKHHNAKPQVNRVLSEQTTILNLNMIFVKASLVVETKGPRALGLSWLLKLL
jgi:hypothetical protein